MNVRYERTEQVKYTSHSRVLLPNITASKSDVFLGISLNKSGLKDLYIWYMLLKKIILALVATANTQLNIY